MKKLKAELKRKTENELRRYQFVGAEIKNCRLKLSKTLDSIANVNKSISYISKIENNRIVPNESSLTELCNELSISNEDLENMNNFDSTLINVLDALYKGNGDFIEESYKKYASFTNIRTQLMNGLYYCYKNEYNVLEDIVEQLSKVEGCLNLDDYLIYIFLSCVLLIKNNEILKAYKIIKYIIDSKEGIDEMICLFKVKYLDLKLNFGLGLFQNDFNEILKIHSKNHNIKLLEKLIINIKEKEIELCDLEDLEDIVKDVTDAGLLCYANIRNNNVEEATKYFSSNINAKFVIKYHFMMKNVKELEKMIDENKFQSDELLVLCNYYFIKLTQDENILREYISNTCINFYINSCQINNLIDLYQELLEINSRQSKYKETCIISQKVTSLIKELTKII